MSAALAQRRRNRGLSLLVKPVQGRLLIGPQVTNLPHKGAQ